MEEALVNLLNSYKEPDDIEKLIETHDLFGKNCFYYIHLYELNTLLNTPIFDKYITSKWNGNLRQDCSINDFSTSNIVLKNSHDRILGGKFVMESWNHITNVKSQIRLQHDFGIASWKRSMKIRYITESAVALIMTVLFQILISDFNWFVHDLNRVTHELEILMLSSNPDPAEVEKM